MGEQKQDEASQKRPAWRGWLVGAAIFGSSAIALFCAGMATRDTVAFAVGAVVLLVGAAVSRLRSSGQGVWRGLCAWLRSASLKDFARWVYTYRLSVAVALLLIAGTAFYILG